MRRFDIRFCMNWQAIAFDWNQVRAFLATAEEGSFSAAARVLRSTQPTVGRQVAALEEALGVTLFERGARGLLLTGGGRDLLEHVRAMGDAASRVSLVAAGQAQDVSGEVSVTAVDLLGSHFVIPVVKRMQTIAPGLGIRIIATNEIQNLARREADIAVRHVRPEQPDLVARLITEFTARFYASPGYLDRVGRPRALQDITRYRIVGATDPDAFMAAAAHRGLVLSPDQFDSPCDNGLIVRDMVLAGMGMTMLPDEICADDPRFECVLPDLPTIVFPVWLTTHRELHTSRRIRLVFDALAEELARPRTASAH